LAFSAASSAESPTLSNELAKYPRPTTIAPIPVATNAPLNAFTPTDAVVAFTPTKRKALDTSVVVAAYIF
jgi:hypothetical protein